MSFSLAQAALLPLAALIAVPLLVHLFARSKPPVYRFSSIELLRRLQREMLRIKRPRDWLLLLIRTLLFAAAVLTFLQPLFFGKQRLSSAFERKNLAVIVDASASMGALDGGRTRFAAACAEASEVLSTLTARDTANVIWLDSHPDAVFPELGVNLEYLRRELRRAGVTYEAGDIEGAFLLASELLEETEGACEVCVVSDFQAEAWANARPQLPSKIRRMDIKIGETTPPNVALTRIEFRPALPLVGEKVTILCETMNYSPEPQQRKVYLSAGESRQTMTISMEPWSGGVAVFQQRFSVEGVMPVVAALEEDGFNGDDTRRRVLNVRKNLRAGLLTNDEASGIVWRKALDSLGWIETTELDVEALNGELPYDLILLSEWNGQGQKSLQQATSNGAQLICMPADGVNVRAFDWCGVSKAPADAVFRWEELKEPRKLRIPQGEDELFQLFATGEFGDPAEGSFLARLSFAWPDLPADKILMTYDDDLPALARMNESCYLWNLPLSAKHSNYAARTEFLPLFAELLLQSRKGMIAHQSRMEYTAGEKPAWKFESREMRGDLKLLSLDGKELAFERGEGTRALHYVASQPPLPGLYQWMHGNQLLGVSAVNFPASESDLRSMTTQQLDERSEALAASAATIRRMRDGLALWPYLLMLALGLAILEGATALWVERS